MSDKNQLKAFQLNVANAWAELESQLIESEGEINQELEIRLKHFATNVDTAAGMIERLKNFEMFMEWKSEQFAKMAKSAANSADFIKETIKNQMIDKNIKELSGNESRLALVNSIPSVEIADEEKLDPAYKIKVELFKIDKNRIKEDLKLGVPVAGAVLKEGKHIRIYPSRKVE